MNLSDKGLIDVLNISEVGITEGLVGWWPLIKDTRDISLAKAHATIVGATKNSGPKGGAYSLGLNKRIDTPYTDMTTFINTNGGFTISVFAKFDGTGSANSEGILFGGDGYNWGLVHNCTGANIRMLMWSDSGDNVKTLFTTANVPVNNNQWYHITGSFELATNKLKIYLDGILKSTTVMLKPFWINIKTLRFGTSSATWWNDASVYDGRLYNRALTDEEVGILYGVTSRANSLKMTNKCIYLAGQLKEV